jgi:chromosomal replication initiator protein
LGRILPTDSPPGQTESALGPVAGPVLGGRPRRARGAHWRAKIGPTRGRQAASEVMATIRCPAQTAAAIVARPPAPTPDFDVPSRPGGGLINSPRGGAADRPEKLGLMEAKQVWRAALGELQVSLSPANFETWLKDTHLVEIDDNRYRISAPNGFARDWLDNRYRPLISQTLARVVGGSVQVEFVVADASGPVPEQVDEEAQVAMPPLSAGGNALNLNSRYTFSNFIVGSANRLAHAAALSVAERPGNAYNPLFLYGGVGLGKTHLMHAIGNGVAAKFPRKRILYATSEKFTNDFINSIREQKMEDFRNRYRRIDVLLIDDIQFIAERERTQEEFFHTFNAIHEAGKQVVLSSDRPPKAITTLEERLRSRFEWGLIADLTPPDLETRIAILRSKAEDQLHLIPSEVIDFIARKVVSNVRELEGALNRVVAYASMSGMPVNIELASAVLSNVMYNPRKKSITPQRIVRAVADYYGVNLDQLRSSKRDRAIVVPRQIAMFLIREETDISLLRIGAELGGRDHSTVLHACDKIARELNENDEMRREISAVREMIYSE